MRNDQMLAIKIRAIAPSCGEREVLVQKHESGPGRDHRAECQQDAEGLQAHAPQDQAITAAGLAYMVCFASHTRLGRCARSECGLAFVDTSRNGRRAYCSVRCANNDAVARHRRAHSMPSSKKTARSGKLDFSRTSCVSPPRRRSSAKR